MKSNNSKVLHVCVFPFNLWKIYFDLRDLPTEFHSEFLTESPGAKARLEALKNRIYSSSIEVYKG